MANEFYTLIVVPHAKARFRKFQVSVRLTRWVLWACLGLSLAFAGILTHYTWISVEVADLRHLRAENLALATKARAYEQNASQLQAKVLALQNMVTKLGMMAGVEQSLPDAGVGGVGGLSGVETTVPSLDIASSLRSLDDRVGTLTEKSSRLESIFESQREMLASTPSVWPVRGYLSAAFGNRTDPFTGQPDFHPGLDISTPRGTKIVGSRGRCHRLRRPEERLRERDGRRSRLRRHDPLRPPRCFEARPGQRVRRGDVIGFVGNTGRSTAPHLHYEVWVNDQARNPIQYILDEYRSFG